MTNEYRLWRACERFGIDPRLIGRAGIGFISRLLAFEDIRGEEEARTLALTRML